MISVEMELIGIGFLIIIIVLASIGSDIYRIRKVLEKRGLGK